LPYDPGAKIRPWKQRLKVGLFIVTTLISFVLLLAKGKIELP
jgi:hypothetical protein